MGRHSAPTLIRFWPDLDGDSINVLVNDWNDGTFTVADGHPLIYAIERSWRGHLTVLDSEEVEWHVETVSIYGGVATFACVSRRDHLRSSLRPDEWVLKHLELTNAQ